MEKLRSTKPFHGTDLYSFPGIHSPVITYTMRRGMGIHSLRQWQYRPLVVSLVSSFVIKAGRAPPVLLFSSGIWHTHATQ